MSSMGRPRGPGPRSMELLSWIERLDVVGFEPLMLAHRLSARATYSHLERLEGAGLVERTYDRHGSVVAITGRGRRTSRPELSGARPASPALSRGMLLAHARAVSWIAARLTLRPSPWVTEREMRSLNDWQIEVYLTQGRGRHRPDLGYLDTRGPVAVEVELTAKSARRLKSILEGYEHAIETRQLRAVAYVTDHAGVRRAVERAAESFTSPGNIHHLDLSDVKDSKRAAASQLTLA